MRPIGTKAELERRRRLGAALHRRGYSIRDVAKQLGCAPGSVARWTKMLESGGDAALDPIPNAGGKSRLSEVQRLQLSVILRLGARSSGFATELWTLRRVRDVIEREFGIRYSISAVHLIVGALGFSPQKAVRRAREQDVAAVERFREEEWPRIKKKRKAKAASSR